MDSLNILQLSVYTTGEKALMATAACSLLVSILIEVFLFYTISQKSSAKVRGDPRRNSCSTTVTN
jgi:hypothetical protein